LVLRNLNNKMNDFTLSHRFNVDIAIFNGMIFP